MEVNNLVRTNDLIIETTVSIHICKTSTIAIAIAPVNYMHEYTFDRLGYP